MKDRRFSLVEYDEDEGRYVVPFDSVRIQTVNGHMVVELRNGAVVVKDYDVAYKDDDTVTISGFKGRIGVTITMD